MATKEQLKINIKEWMQYEKDLKILQKKTREIKQAKKELTDKIVKVMKDKDIDCFDLNDGKLIYNQSKTKSAINGKYLTACLEKYFKNTGDQEMVEDLTKYIMENREVKIKDTIRHKIQKNNDE
jgi:hypothetical protein